MDRSATRNCVSPKEIEQKENCDPACLIEEEEESTLLRGLNWTVRIAKNPLLIFNVPRWDMTEELWSIAVVRDPRLITFVPREFSNKEIELMKIRLGKDLMKSSSRLFLSQRMRLNGLFVEYGETDFFSK